MREIVKNGASLKRRVSLKTISFKKLLRDRYEGCVKERKLHALLKDRYSLPTKGMIYDFDCSDSLNTMKHILKIFFSLFYHFFFFFSFLFNNF